MTFSKFFSILLLAHLLIACSGSVQDKNAEMSASEKQDLKSDQVDDSIQIKSMNFIGVNDIREDSSEDSNIIARYYTLKVCLQDRNMARNLRNKKFEVAGEEKYTDASGCVVFEHEIQMDYTSDNKCKVFSQELNFGNKKVKTIKYSVDYLNNNLSDLDQSKGCTKGQEKLGNVDLSALSMGDVNLTHGGILTKMRSDLRWVKHKTKVNACIKVTKTGKSLVNAYIGLKAKNLETNEEVKSNNSTLRTDRYGCFTTDIVSKYEQYKYSHWMPIDLEIDVRSGALAGETIKRKIYLNPWEPRSREYGIGEFGRIPEEVEFENEYAGLHLDGIMYIQIGNDKSKLNVNNYMGLSLSKTYQVVLNPYINREHRYTAGTKPVENVVHEGKFKLSMVLLAPKNDEMQITKDNFHDFEYITGVEQVVDVKNGVINAEVNIPFKLVDLPKLALRTMSVFKIEPVSDSGLRSNVVTGYFKARIPWIKTNVFQNNDLNTPEYVDQAYSHISKVNKKKNVTSEEMSSTCSTSNDIEQDTCLKGMGQITKYAINREAISYKNYIHGLFNNLEENNKKFNPLSETPIPAKTIFTNHLKKVYPNVLVLNKNSFRRKFGVSLTEKDFSYSFPENYTASNIPPRILNAICRAGEFKSGRYVKTLFGKKEKDYSHCVKNPENYFEMKALRHVNKVNSIGNSYSDGFAIHIDESFGTSKYSNDTESESVSKYISSDVSFKFPLGETLGDLFGLGIKAGISKNWATSHTDGTGFQFADRIGTSESLGVEKFVVEVNAGFERCMLIKSKNYIDEALKLQRRSNARLSYGAIGSVKTEEEMDQEPYYNPTLNYNMTLYICDEGNTQQMYREAWYFVQSEISSSIGRDFDTASGHQLMKAFRGNKNFYELRAGLRNVTNQSLVLDRVGVLTPEEVLIESWGHLLDNSFNESSMAQFLKENVEGSFPGTIEGQGSSPGVDQ